jgi:hypothetical protein
MAFVEYARAVQVSAPLAVGGGVKGRWIRILVDKLVEFWGRHQATLIPYLSQLAIAALQSLVAAQADIDIVDPPGPQ